MSTEPRITSIPKTWAGCPGLRIQSYNGTGKRLNPGAEIPIQNKSDAFDLVTAITNALKESGI